MSKSTEFGFWFEFETPQERNQEYWVKVETELESGWYTFSIFKDNTCKCDITRIVKDLNVEIYKDADREVFSKSEEIRQQYADGEIHPCDLNDI